ncbi:MAG: LegC family aminotransferase [Planctomycetota bacterium]
MQDGDQRFVDSIVGAVRAALGPRDGFTPLHEPEFRGREAEYVLDCVETGWVSSVGAYVDRIEEMLAERYGVERAVALASGTAALHVALLVAGVEPGDEVLCPTLTFVATANSIRHAGATPHFVDAETRSLGVDPAALAEHLDRTCERRGDALFNRATGARVRALVTTHVFGHPGELDALRALADERGLVFVEDAAESIGTTLDGAPLGRHGRVATLSFNGNKVVTTGGGGALLTNDAALGARAKHLSTTARVPAENFGFAHDEVGFNYRMPNLNAALGCAQLERLDDMLERKRALAGRYRDAFSGLDGVRFLDEDERTRSNFWLNAIVLDPDRAHLTGAVLEALNAADLMARPLWNPMHTLPMFTACPRADVAQAEDMARRVVNVPSSPALADPT